MEIKKEFEKIHKEFAKIHKKFDRFEAKSATKDDLKGFATKDDLQRFATKDDLKGFATKDDLIAMENRMDKKFATKSDLNQQTKELKEFALDQTESLARMIARTVAEPLEQHIRQSKKVANNHKF